MGQKVERRVAKDDEQFIMNHQDTHSKLEGLECRSSGITENNSVS